MTIFATALLSAIFTSATLLGVIAWLYQTRIRELIERNVAERVERYGEIIEERVRTGIIRAVDDVTSVEALQKSVSRSQDSFLNALFGVRGGKPGVRAGKPEPPEKSEPRD